MIEIESRFEPPIDLTERYGNVKINWKWRFIRGKWWYRPHKLCLHVIQHAKPYFLHARLIISVPIYNRTLVKSKITTIPFLIHLNAPKQIIPMCTVKNLQVNDLQVKNWSIFASKVGKSWSELSAKWIKSRSQHVVRKRVVFDPP